MKTQVFKLKDGRWLIGYKRHFWSGWSYIQKRFLSKQNAEAYAERFVWKTKHPKRYSRLLEQKNSFYFLGH